MSPTKIHTNKNIAAAARWSGSKSIERPRGGKSAVGWRLEPASAWRNQRIQRKPATAVRRK
jgi:hypothetical protein